MWQSTPAATRQRTMNSLPHSELTAESGAGSDLCSAAARCSAPDGPWLLTWLLNGKDQLFICSSREVVNDYACKLREDQSIYGVRVWSLEEGQPGQNRVINEPENG